MKRCLAILIAVITVALTTGDVFADPMLMCDFFGSELFLVNPGDAPVCFDSYMFEISYDGVNQDNFYGIASRVEDDLVLASMELGSCVDGFVGADLTSEGTWACIHEMAWGGYAVLQPGSYLSLGAVLSYGYTYSYYEFSWTYQGVTYQPERWTSADHSNEPWDAEHYVLDIRESDSITIEPTFTDSSYLDYRWFIDGVELTGENGFSPTFTWAELQAWGIGCGEHDIIVTADPYLRRGTATLTIVPEPASMALLAMGGLAVLKRKKR